MTQKICDVCNVSKSIQEFRQKDDGTIYPSCTVCFLDAWRADQIMFWSNKMSRKCTMCHDVVPLSLYSRDAFGIPYKTCRACFDAKLTREYFEKRNAKAKVAVEEKPAL